MGVYWLPVNLTRREYIDPDHLDCTMKLGLDNKGGWLTPGCPVVLAMQSLWAPDDDVRAIADDIEGPRGVLQLTGTPVGSAPEYDDVEALFTEVGRPADYVDEDAHNGR